MPTANPPPPRTPQPTPPQSPNPPPPRAPQPPPPRSGNVIGQTRVYQPIQQQHPQQQYPQQSGGSGLGIAGMILGIIAVVFAFIPLVGLFIAIPCIAVGLPLSIIGFVRNRRQNQSRGMATAGIACNAVALVLTIISIAITAAAVNEIDEALSGSTSTRSNTRFTSSSATSGSNPTPRPTSTSRSSGSASTPSPARTLAHAPMPTPTPAYFSGRGGMRYEVGVDIEPGTYRTAGAVRAEWGDCSFTRLRNYGGDASDPDEVLESRQMSRWETVTILATDGEFFSSNCHEWIPVQQSAMASSESSDAPTPTPVRLALGAYNPPTEEWGIQEEVEREYIIESGGTPESAPYIPMEAGLHKELNEHPSWSFTDGYWAVGIDIFPGDYATEGPPLGRRVEYPCTFARLRSADGKIDNPDEVIEVIDIWLPPKDTVVTIEPTDGAVYSSNCRGWERQGSLEPSHRATITVHDLTVPRPFGGGDYERDAYTIGREILPGLYQTEGVRIQELGHCIFALMTEEYGDPFVDEDEVVEFYVVDGPAFVRIDDTIAKSFYTYNCKEWKPVDTGQAVTQETEQELEQKRIDAGLPSCNDEDDAVMLSVHNHLPRLRGQIERLEEHILYRVAILDDVSGVVCFAKAILDNPSDDFVTIHYGLVREEGEDIIRIRIYQ